MDGGAAGTARGFFVLGTAGWFVAGAVVTAVFSGSLANLAVNADPVEVLAVGMLVPCLTWVVQLVRDHHCEHDAVRVHEQGVVATGVNRPRG